MLRVIDVIKIDADVEGDQGPRVYSLGFNVALALGWKYDRNKEGIRVGGCGMDMGFHVVYELSRVLFPDGFGEKCRNCGQRPYFIHNGVVDGLTNCSVKSPFVHEFRGRNGDTSGWDNDGGYAINHRWL